MATDGTAFQRSRPIALAYVASPGALADGDQDVAHMDVARGAYTAGTVAHDGADSGNPLKIGARGVSTLPTAVSANDRTDALADLYGRIRVVQSQVPESWIVKHTAAANTQATASKAAGTAAQRHVCKGFMFSLGSVGAPTPEILKCQVRDGATGAGTIVWEGYISLPAVAGESKCIAMSGLYIVGTAATAMTAEFDAAGGANDYQAVSIFGETIPA